MTSQDMRPMSVGEILDGGFTLYRNHFGALIGISIVCLGVPTLLSVYVELAGGMFVHPVLSLLSTLIVGIGWLPASAATVWAVSESYLGRDPALGPSLRYGVRRIGRLMVVGIASYILVLAAFLLFVIPGVVVACGYSVAVQVVVLEELRKSTDALGRSWALTKGNKGKAFQLVLSLGVLYFLPGLAVGAVVAFVPISESTLQVIAQFVSFLLTPWFACVFTLFYHDLRIRKDGFDLELLSQTLERPAPAPA
jgi:hypothetical protein